MTTKRIRLCLPGTKIDIEALCSTQEPKILNIAINGETIQKSLHSGLICPLVNKVVANLPDRKSITIENPKTEEEAQIHRILLSYVNVFIPKMKEKQEDAQYINEITSLLAAIKQADTPLEQKKENTNI